MPSAVPLWALRGPGGVIATGLGLESRTSVCGEVNLKRRFLLLSGASNYPRSSALGNLALSEVDKLPIPVGDNVCIRRWHSQGVTLGTLGAFFQGEGCPVVEYLPEGKLSEY